MKKIFTLLFFLLFAVGNSQTVNLNQYKYVIVNSKFDFVREIDGYQTSSLTKFLFTKMGFKAFLDNEEFDEELAMNRCSSLYVDVRDDSGFLNTKSLIELKDCKGRILYTSSAGSSRFKKYVKAYRESIKEAFNSIKQLGYTYDESLSNKTIETVKVEEKPKVVKKKPIMVTKKVTTKTSSIKEKVKKNSKIESLYAQPKGNGFQLVNTKPEIVFVLLKTNDPEKFIIKDKNGTFVKKGTYWLAEYYENDQLVTKKYQIKF